MVLAHLHCPAGASLSLRSLSHSLLLLQPSFGQLPVSFAPLHSLRPSFRYHYTTFVPKEMLHFMASHLQAHKANTPAGSTFHFANQRYNTHWVSLTLHYVLHSFQSRSVHPLPIILRALRACPSCGFVMVFDPQHKGLKEIKNTRQTLAFLVAAYRTNVLCSHHWGRRTQPPPVVPPFGVFDGTLRSNASLRTSVPQGFSFFFAAGAITFSANAHEIQEKQGR